MVGYGGSFLFLVGHIDIVISLIPSCERNFTLVVMTLKVDLN